MKKTSILFAIFTLTISPTFLYSENFEDSKLTLASALDKEGQRLQDIQDEFGIEFAHSEFNGNFNQLTTILKETFYQQAQFTPKSEVIKILKNLQNESSSDEIIHSILEDRSLSPTEKLYEISLGSFIKNSKENFEHIQQRAEVMGYKKTFQELADLYRSRTPQDFSIFCWHGKPLNTYYFLIFSGGIGNDNEDFMYWSENGRLKNYDVRFANAAIGLGFMGYFSDGPVLSYKGEGPIDGTYWGVHLSVVAFLGGTLGFFLNDHGRLILFGGGGGLGVGLGITKITITTRPPVDPGPDVDDERYKVRPYPLPR